MGERRMYSMVQRLNTLSTITVTNVAAFTCVLALSTFYFHLNVDMEPHVDVKINAVHKFGRLGVNRYYGNEEAHVTLDLDADLRPLLHWNVKQLFVFVSASYTTKLHKTSEVVLWDFIISSKEQAQFYFQGVTNKYPLVDKGKNLRNANITLKFHWNTMPHSGLLFFHSKAGSSPMTFPSKYIQGNPDPVPSY
uniref:Signal peptidase complex subunit 3 n=1 Tax=Eutreptiella gymnastica TaxID=73025 RepID=A0A7S1NJW9_9EUGL